jgi:hypothetical protein
VGRQRGAIHERKRRDDEKGFSAGRRCRSRNLHIRRNKDRDHDG